MFKTVLLAALLATAASDAAPISAGQWRVSDDLKVLMINGRRQTHFFPVSDPGATCLKSDQAVKGPGLAFNDPELCRVLNSKIDGSNYEYTLECKVSESKDLTTTKVSGTFAKDSYTGKAVSIQRRGSTVIEMRSDVYAKRIGDC